MNLRLVLNYLPEKNSLGGRHSGKERQLLIHDSIYSLLKKKINSQCLYFLFKENNIKVDEDGVGIYSAGHFSVRLESKVASQVFSLFMKCQR